MSDNLELIVFDVDGTLAETDDYYVEKLVKAGCKVLLFIKPETMTKIVRPIINTGETILHGLYRLLDMVGLDALISKIHSKLSVKNDYRYEMVSGMRDTIEKLSKHYKIGIITSGGQKSTEAFLKKYSLEEFVNYTISSEDCRFIKPNPEPLLQMAAEAQIPPENCLLVGDTIFDILCAHRAGANIAAVKSGFDSVRFINMYKPDVVLDSAADLPAWLELNEDETVKKTDNPKDLV